MFAQGKIIAVMTILLSICTMAGAEEEGKLYLVKNGQAVATVVIPEDADKWNMKAVEWLNEYMEKATGVKFDVLTEEKAASGTLISVGHTQLAEKAGIDVRGLKYDGCKLAVKGRVLYLIGRDSKREIKTSPLVGAKGTCKAVLTFLEEFCGVRWFLPTPMGEVVPKAKDISVPKDLKKTFVPAFGYSDGRATYNNDFFTAAGGTPASIANNFRNAIAVWPGGHTYIQAVPAAKYFQTHPEYFALIDGQRTGEGNHLCSTNPEVRQILLNWMRDRFDEGYELVSIGQADGYLRCQCPKCEKMDNYRYKSLGLAWDDFLYGKLKDTPCERLFFLHKWVIDKVRESHPDKQVLLMCYAPTAWPSKKIKYFGDNAFGELTNQEPEFINAWQGKLTGFTGYIYWFDIHCPMGMDVHATAKEVAEKIRYLHKNGFIGLYQFAETNWGFQGPVFYELGKLMGDPRQDYKVLIREYCQGVFGKASNTMLMFFSLLYARHEKVLPLAVEDFSGRTSKMPSWAKNNTPELYLRHYPRGFLNRLEQLLQKAEAEADTERSRGWLKLTRDHFDFTKLLTRALISYRAYQKDQSKKNWLELKKRVEDFEAYRMKIITYPKEYTDLWFPGYDRFCLYLTADAQHPGKVSYMRWEKRKAEVLLKGIKGMAIGFSDFPVKEPLTLDFSEEKR